MSLNGKKSTFCENKIKFLGFEVSANGLQIDESRIRLLKSIPVPKDKKSLYRFLGMVTFLRRFVPNFTNKTVHMRTNLRKDAKFNFDNDCLDEFHYIIDQLTADFLSRCFSDMPEAERIKFLPSNVDSDTDFIMTITGDEPLVDTGNCTDTDEQLCFDSSSKQNDKKDELCYYAVCFSPTENGILSFAPDNNHKNIHKKTGLVLSHDNNLLLAFRVQLHSVV